VKTFTKPYPGPAAVRQAQDHHRLIARLNPDVRIPAIIRTRPTEIDFEHLEGHHSGPDDILLTADLLGHQHATAYARELHAARLDTPHCIDGITISDFTNSRQGRIQQALTSGTVTDPLLTPATAGQWLAYAATLPAALYKDANPRNFFINGTRVAVIDFDSLTLAPFGYDLAKLIVTTTMTAGPLPDSTINLALDTYNRHPRSYGIPKCSLSEFAAWTEFHHILTEPYLGTNGYRFAWNDTRPDGLAHLHKTPPPGTERSRPDHPSSP
jgi:hypothetical protein